LHEKKGDLIATAPSIVTNRLVLRAHRAEDHPECTALWGSTEVTRFIGGATKSPQEAWFRILQYTGSWQLIGYGLWAICDRESGALLGEGGFGDFRRGIAELEGAPEIGWAFAPQAWGCGIAT
jgi:RimJ/RimL family protein N-acetyltransferase